MACSMVLNGELARVLSDSGADHTILHPGLACHEIVTYNVNAERFDGTVTRAREVRRCTEDIVFEGNVYPSVPFIEWPLSAQQDVILGSPWLSQFNPRIDWTKQTLEFEGAAQDSADTLLENELDVVTDDTFHEHFSAGAFAEVYSVKVRTAPARRAIDPAIAAITKEFSDVFQKEISPELPPVRSIQHEVVLKPGTKPSNRPPFCLSKVEQEALDRFVADPLKKNWIEVSDSPWASNIFGVPKKDLVTGKSPLRLEWLHSNDPNMPIRVVISVK